MAVHLIAQYAVAVAGLVAGAAAGFVLVERYGADRPRATRLGLPLVLAAGTAHAFLVPVVEPTRQAMFMAYFAAMVAVFLLGLGRVGVWRMGAVLLPAASIAGYAYFAVAAREADYAGLLVKVVEAAVIVAAVVPSGSDRRASPRRRSIA